MKGTRKESGGGWKLAKQGSMKCVMKEVEFGPLKAANSSLRYTETVVSKRWAPSRWNSLGKGREVGKCTDGPVCDVKPEHVRE